MDAFQDEYLDESKTRVSDILTIEKPKVSYIYDYGDSWYHIIQLEKILNDTSLDLPAILGGKRRAPDEDSRGQFVLDCTTLINMSNDPKQWATVEDDLGIRRRKAIASGRDE